MKQRDVDSILLTDAPSFWRNAASGQIKALCSNKGKFGKKYYGKQFQWLKAAPKKRRRLKRVFVRTQGARLAKAGFSKGELDGIRMHLTQASLKIRVRWVWHDDELLDHQHGDSLGFAVLGTKWLVHWGLKSGYCSQSQDDKAVAKLLTRHFDALWNKAEDFSDELLRKLFGQHFMRRHAGKQTAKTR